MNHSKMLRHLLQSLAILLLITTCLSLPRSVKAASVDPNSLGIAFSFGNAPDFLDPVYWQFRAIWDASTHPELAAHYHITCVAEHYGNEGEYYTTTTDVAEGILSSPGLTGQTSHFAGDPFMNANAPASTPTSWDEISQERYHYHISVSIQDQDGNQQVAGQADSNYSP